MHLNSLQLIPKCCEQVFYSNGKQFYLAQYHPVGKIGDPGEIARFALFIGDDGNAYLNGACISLDGEISSCLHDPS